MRTRRGDVAVEHRNDGGPVGPSGDAGAVRRRPERLSQLRNAAHLHAALAELQGEGLCGRSGDRAGYRARPLRILPVRAAPAEHQPRQRWSGADHGLAPERWGPTGLGVATNVRVTHLQLTTISTA
jgi:hypothetical protein